jgi:transposase
VSLEDLVPQNHVYRRLETTQDLSVVREWVTKYSAQRGRPAIDPVVSFNVCPS